MSADVFGLDDQHVRDEIVSPHQGAMFVEAGAGSGKTHQLTSRIVGLIGADKATIDQIVAITFTNAAAAELRDRVRQLLIDRAAEPDIGPDVAARYGRALAEIDVAQIGTIHSFAQRILTEAGPDAGLPPTIRLLDDAELLQRRRAVARRCMVPVSATDTTQSQTEREYWQAALLLGFSLGQVEDVVKTMFDNWHRIDPSSGAGLVTPLTMKTDELVAKLGSIVDQAPACRDQSDNLYLHLVDVCAPLHKAMEGVGSSDVPSRLSMLAGSGRLKFSKGKAPNWPPGVKGELVELLAEADELRTAALGQVGDACTWHVLDHIGRQVLLDARKRIEIGHLSFSDLVVLARDLLAASPSWVARLRGRYRYVMVDEFQDTDPLQSELLTLLCGQAGEVPLFTVGDPRQSIYRFRGADLQQYLKLRNSQNRVLQLVSNFRTTRPVLDFVQQATAATWTPGSTTWATDMPARVNEVVGSVTKVGGLVDASTRAAAVRQQESQELAQRIAAMVATETLVEGECGPRPVRFGDIGILLPTRAGLPALERALNGLSIAYRIESRSMIWNSQEAADLVSILEAVCDPEDSVAVVAALRTPALGCDDRQLLEWHRQGGDWSVSVRLSGPGHVTGQVADGLAWLSQATAITRAQTASEAVDWVLQQLSLRAIVATSPRPRESWRRLAFLVDGVRRWEADCGGSLAQFVRWARAQAANDVDVHESAVPDSDEDAVRIMTIHASKGLEFPVVALLGLASNPKGGGGSGKLLWGTTGMEARLGRKENGLETNGFATCLNSEREQDESEWQRLLYVALTRVRDHLIVGVHRNGPSAFLDWVDDHLPAEQDLELPVTTGAEPSSAPGIAWDPDSALAANADVFNKATQRSWVSATRIEEVLGPPPASDGHGRDHGQSSGLDREASRAVGTAVHGVLERCDLSDFDPELVAGVCSELGVEPGPLQERVERSVRLALDSESVTEARAGLGAGRHCVWREFPVSATVGDLVIEGVVDLCFQTPAGLVVVDFKTEAPSGDDAQRYHHQLATYAFAIEAATGLEVTSARLIFIDADLDSAIEQEVDTRQHLSSLAKQIGEVLVSN